MCIALHQRKVEDMLLTIVSFPLFQRVFKLVGSVVARRAHHHHVSKNGFATVRVADDVGGLNYVSVSVHRGDTVLCKCGPLPSRKTCEYITVFG